MKKLFTFLTAAFFVTAVSAQEVVEFSHNFDDEIVAGSGVACPGGDNEFARLFYLSDFGITDDFIVTQIDWGIESLQGSEDLTVNLYLTDFDFPYGDFDLLWSDESTYPAQDITIIETSVPNIPVSGSADAILASIAQDDTGINFFPGGTMPGTFDDVSWLKSINCGADDFQDVQSLGDFPTANWYIVVRGETDMGTVELGTAASMGVYPNPATDVINVSLRNGANAQSIEIVNLAGQNVANAKAASNVNISFLPAGVYVIKVKDDKGVTHMSKFVKK